MYIYCFLITVEAVHKAHPGYETKAYVKRISRVLIECKDQRLASHGQKSLKISSAKYLVGHRAKVLGILD